MVFSVLLYKGVLAAVHGAGTQTRLGMEELKLDSGLSHLEVLECITSNQRQGERSKRGDRDQVLKFSSGKLFT